MQTKRYHLLLVHAEVGGAPADDFPGLVAAVDFGNAMLTVAG